VNRPTTGHPALAGGPIYLDYNATTPVDPRVLAAAQPFLSDHFGNPSTDTTYGRAAREGITVARGQVADLLGSQANEIIFTSSGTESNILALRGAVLANPDRGSHVITQRTEHPAVLETCRALERLHGITVTHLPVDHFGQVDPAQLDAAITPSTVLVSIMHANNETGTLQPIARLAEITHRHGALFHTDAAQSVGKFPTLVDELGVDLLTVAGHKLYAPKGVGALYTRPGVRLEPLLYGGGQERGLRSGTENVALIVALGQAAAIARAELPTSQARLRGLRDRLHRRITDALGDRAQLNGHPLERLPNTLNVSIAGHNGSELLANIPEIAAATGSACHETGSEPSPVLTAMGLPAARAGAALRLTLGHWTTADEIGTAGELITAACR
jgi:cysteine desulfurase